MSRKFSIIRRKPKLVDVVIPLIAGVDTYRLKAATNFDGTYTTFVEAKSNGYMDPSLADRGHPLAAGEHSRIVFDPTTFSLDDTKPFWMKFAPVSGGSEGTNTPGILVMPAGAVASPIIALRGSAPVGVSVANSLEFHLPKMMTDLRIKTEDATNALYVAFEAGGAEIKITADADFQNLSHVGNFASLFVRSDAAPVAFSATCTPAFPR